MPAEKCQRDIGCGGKLACEYSDCERHRGDMFDKPKTGLPFIITTDRVKTDPETRKFIRSHVMRGKNRVKARRKPQKTLHGEKPRPEFPMAADLVRFPSVSRLLSSNLSGIRFADDAVEPALVADVVAFSSMFSKAMFVLNPCMLPKSSDKERAWLAPLVFDAAYLNAICITVQAFFDGFLARTRNAESRRRDCVYFGTAVRILQERLEQSDESVRLSNSTIMTVLALSAHAYMMGDYESTDHHLKGLLRLVSMRGVETFFQNPKLLIEILRSDLVMANDQGSEPVLLPYDGIPWPLKTRAGFHMTHDRDNPLERRIRRAHGCTDSLDPELADIWIAMSDFCVTVNAATPNDGQKMTEEYFLHSMGSIMYRLLHRRFDVGSVDEVFRMGILAFSSPIFLNWNRVELPDYQFTSAYRDTIATLIRTSSMFSAQERLWLLMVGALIMSHETESFAWIKPTLRTSIDTCGLSTWIEMRRVLTSFLWIELVYDQAGQEIYERTMS